jgi:hypothetical protein
MAVSAEMTDMIQCKPVLFLAAMVWFRFMVYGGVLWCVVCGVVCGGWRVRCGRRKSERERVKVKVTFEKSKDLFL